MIWNFCWQMPFISLSLVVGVIIGIAAISHQLLMIIIAGLVVGAVIYVVYTEVVRYITFLRRNRE